MKKKTLGGITGYFSSYGSYFFTIIVGILILYNLVSQNFHIAGVWFILFLILFFWLFRKNNRYRNVEFDNTRLYVDGNKEIPLADITKLSKGIIEYSEGQKTNKLYFVHLPNDPAFEELKNLVGK